MFNGVLFKLFLASYQERWAQKLSDLLDVITLKYINRIEGMIGE